MILLERAPALGGLAASFEVADIRVDHGSHRLHPATAPAILAELRSLLGNDLQRRPRHGRIRLADGWVEFPPSPIRLLGSLPPRMAMRLASDLVAAPWRRPVEDTYAEVVRARVGTTLGEHLYFPFAHKLWGTSPEELAGEQARRRIATTSPAALVTRVLRRSSGRHFFYPRKGFGQITEAIADAASSAGADLVVGAEVTGVDIGDAGGIRVRTTDDRIREAGVVLSTIPLATLVGLVSPAAPGDVSAAARAQTSRAMVLVYPVLDRPAGEAPPRQANRQTRWTSFDAHYVPTPGIPATRVSEPRNYRDNGDSEPADRTVLCVEIPCSVGDELWSASDVDLVGRVVEDLGRIDLPPIVPVGWEVRRVQSAYPVYRIGHEHDLDVVEQWLKGFPGLVTLGRQGLFAHDNTHHTLEMAWEAVASLQRDGGFDASRWAEARDRFRTHVVQD